MKRAKETGRRDCGKMNNHWCKVSAMVCIVADDVNEILYEALNAGCISEWSDAVRTVGDKLGELVCEQIALGGALILHDIEDDSEKWELDLERFLNGFKLWVEQGLDKYGAVQKDGTVDCGEIDAACADEIVQLALFGEIVYC